MSNTKANKIENIRQVAYGANQVADFMNFQIRIGTEVDSEEYSQFFYWASEFIHKEARDLYEETLDLAEMPGVDEVLDAVSALCAASVEKPESNA